MDHATAPVLRRKYGVSSTGGYCEAHLTVAVIDELKTLNVNIENLNGFVRHITRDVERAADRADGSEV